MDEMRDSQTGVPAPTPDELARWLDDGGRDAPDPDLSDAVGMNSFSD